MAKFKVEVIRTAYAVKHIEIEADSVEDAYEQALDEAGSHLFSEHTANYEIESVIKISE